MRNRTKNARLLRAVRPNDSVATNPADRMYEETSVEASNAAAAAGPVACARASVKQADAHLGRPALGMELRPAIAFHRAQADALEDIADERDARASGHGLRVANEASATERRRERLLRELAALPSVPSADSARAEALVEPPPLEAFAAYLDRKKWERVWREAVGARFWLPPLGSPAALALVLREETEEGRAAALGYVAQVEGRTMAEVRADMLAWTPEKWAERSEPSFTVSCADGTEVVFRKGDRLTWGNPCGLGGTELSGIFLGAHADNSGTCRFVGIDAEPSESLRALAAEIGIAVRGAKPAPPLGLSWPATTHVKTGIDGYGGVLVVTSEAFERAANDRSLVFAPAPGSEGP